MAQVQKTTGMTGLGVTHKSWTHARDALREHFVSFIPVQVITLAPEMCVRAQEDHKFSRIVESSGIVVADGVGVAWGEGYLTGHKPEKIPGIDLATWALEEVDRIGGSIYLLGARPDIVESAATTISREYPRLTVSGWMDGYFKDSEEENVVAAIASAEPHLLLVGMGSPKQEIFISKHINALRCAVAMGVGGSFDVWSGTIRRAPAFIQKTGTEWLYRTISQPCDRLRRIPILIKFVMMVMHKSANL